MKRGALLLGLVLALTGFSLPPASAAEPLEVPPARVGDAWSLDVASGLYLYDLEVEGRTAALDRWGGERDAFAVRVEGFNPLTFISMTVTGHRIYVDATSGTQVADVAVGVLDFGPSAVSKPGAYSAFSPNDPDGWPGWTLAGGVLAGRRLVPGESVEVPLVVTRTRGNDRIVLEIEEAPNMGGARCVRAVGAAVYPHYIGYQDGVGYDRGEVRVTLDALECEDSPYAARTVLTFEGSFEHSVEVVRTGFQRGEGDAIGTGPYQEADQHVLASPLPFDGSLRDGGPLELFGVEEAQDAAAAAPGLAAWRLLHPDAYLVEADYAAVHRDDQTLVTLGLAAEQWRLTYAAPSGSQHQVVIRRREGAVTTLDMPQVEPYPADVPPLATWPAEMVPPAGAIAAWRSLAGPEARLGELRWEPLLDHRWHVVSELPMDCEQEPCGTAVTGLDMMFDVETGAATEGLHPMPPESGG